MNLSHLQQHILITCWQKGGLIDRKFFSDFYVSQKRKIKFTNQEKIITQSLERLINRGLLIGFGRRTSYKWFITNLRLTKNGQLAVQKIWEEKQAKLPIK